MVYKNVEGIWIAICFCASNANFEIDKIQKEEIRNRRKLMCVVGMGSRRCQEG